MRDVLDPPVSAFSLSLYRHPFLYTLFSSHFTLIINNKQKKTIMFQFLDQPIGFILVFASLIHNDKLSSHAHRSIGYRNRNPHQPLTDSSARLMYLRVYDSRDISRQPVPSPSLSYSFTQGHRSIGYRHHPPQPLSDSSTRLMYLRVYDSRVSSHQTAPSPSLCYSLTHGHSTFPTPTLITIT